jgi:RHS repeat-associated protein
MKRVFARFVMGILAAFCLMAAHSPTEAASTLRSSNVRIAQMRVIGTRISRNAPTVGGLSSAPNAAAAPATAVVPGEPTFLSAFAEYYTGSCTEVSSGSWTVTAAPSSGTVSSGTVTGPSTNGDCPGVEFVYGAIYYTWNTGSTATSDTFSATWKSPDYTEPETFDLTPSTVNPPKNQGCPCSGVAVGDPINSGAGNLFEAETDFVGAPNTQLELRRYNNSQIKTTVSAFGANWSSTFNRFVMASGSTAKVTRPNGQVESFTKTGSTWVSDPDVTDVLMQVAGGWQLLSSDDSVEAFSSNGALSTITTRAGLVTKMTYNTSNQLAQVTGPFGHILSFAYNGNGLISRMTTPDGGVYAYAYDANSNLISVTYPDNSKRQYVYQNANFTNFLTGVIDEDGNPYSTWTYAFNALTTSSQHANGVDLTKLTYNSDGSTTITDARGNSHTSTFTTQFGMVKMTAISGAPVQTAAGRAFTYDANGFIASRTDWNGNVTAYTHDARGDETSRTLASGTSIVETVTTAWLTTFHLPTQIIEPNRTTTFGYDSNGNLLTRTLTSTGLTSRWSYTYNSAGQVLTATDPRGEVTTYAYDAKGDLVRATNAKHQGTQFTSFDPDGRPLTILDPNGLLTTLTYNFRGEVTSRIEAQWVTTYAYDPVGQLTTLTRPDGSRLAFTYDAAHRVIGVADSLGNHIVYTLDATSNRVKEQVFNASNALIRTRSFTYDYVNRLSQAIGALGQTTNYSYDTQGNLTRVADPLYDETANSYDAMNRLVDTVDPTYGATSFGYDPESRLTSVTDPRRLPTSYAYDGLDDVTALASPDTGLTTKTYDAAGNVAESIDARGRTAIYTHDALGRISHVAYSDGKTITYEYDQGANGVGRLTSMSDPGGTTAWTYDIHGRVTSREQRRGAVSLTTRRTYNAVTGQLASLTYPSGATILFGYDADGRVTSLVEALSGGNATLLQTATYQPFGPVAGWVAGNGAAYSRTFDTDGRIIALKLPASDNIALAYDAASRITSIAETGLPTKTFQYDASSRLKNYVSGSNTQTYAYDLDGNRTSYVSTGSSPLNLTYSNDTASNRLLAITGTWTDSFAYDAAGDTVTYKTGGTYDFAYDARGRMSSSALGAFVTDYLVNGLGQRTSKITDLTITPTYFAYDEAGRLLGRYNSRGVAIEETVWLGDLPVATLQSAGRFYIAPDHLGAPHEITNGAAQTVWFWDHDPFGNGAPAAATGFSYDLRLPGQLYDAETGLNYNYYRDYDPVIGRYFESDPIGLEGGVNTYAYVRGSPLAYIDSRGEVSAQVAAIVGVVIVGIIQQIEYYQWASTPPAPYGSGPVPPSPSPHAFPLPPPGTCTQNYPYGFGYQLSPNQTYLNAAPPTSQSPSPDTQDDAPEIDRFEENTAVPTAPGGGTWYPVPLYR